MQLENCSFIISFCGINEPPPPVSSTGQHGAGPLNWTNLDVTRSPSTTPILSFFPLDNWKVTTFPLFSVSFDLGHLHGSCMTCHTHCWHLLWEAPTQGSVVDIREVAWFSVVPFRMAEFSRESVVCFLLVGVRIYAQSTYRLGIVVSTCCLQTMFGHFQYPLTNPHLIVCLVFWRDETCVYNQLMSS